MRRVLGGRVRMFVSGGAPLQSNIKTIIQVIFAAPVFECYGATELAGCLTSTSRWERKGGHVGGVLPCLRMHLRDVPELDSYTGGKTPAGQIYVKGNSVFAGYFKNPKLTMETLDEDGWLRVGDVGKLLPNGAIVLIDRVKEVRKTQNGQFVAPARLEAIYVNVPLVNQIYIDINSTYSFIVAVVTLVEERLKQYADVNGLEGDVETLIQMHEVKFGVLK